MSFPAHIAAYRHKDTCEPKTSCQSNEKQRDYARNSMNSKTIFIDFDGQDSSTDSANKH